MSEQQYLEFEAGNNEVYLTGISYKKPEGKRPHIKLNFAMEASADNQDSPFTSECLYFPNIADSQFARISMDKKLKNVLFPILELDPKAKVKMSEVFPKIVETLDNYDMKVNVDISLKEGKNVNEKTGDVVVFTEINSLVPLELVKKVPYETAFDLEDLDDLPF